jgi:hypothetical protein
MFSTWTSPVNERWGWVRGGGRIGLDSPGLSHIHTPDTPSRVHVTITYHQTNEITGPLCRDRRKAGRCEHTAQDSHELYVFIIFISSFNPICVISLTPPPSCDCFRNKRVLKRRMRNFYEMPNATVSYNYSKLTSRPSHFP